MTVATAAEIEHYENMECFEQAVQSAIYEGWEPLGPPQFVDGWTNGSVKRILQPLVCKRSEDDVTNTSREPILPRTTTAASPRKQTYSQRGKKAGAEKLSAQFRF
jgi:hypothetical protein